MKPCRHDAYEAIPKGRVSLDIDESERLLSAKGYEILSNPKVMLVVRKGVEISIYPRGRLLMHPVTSRSEAEGIAQALYKDLGR